MSTLDQFFLTRLKAIHSFIGLLQNEIDVTLKKMESKTQKESQPLDSIKKCLSEFINYLKTEKGHYSKILQEHNRHLQEQKTARIKSKFDIPSSISIETPKLSKFEVSRTKAITSYLLKAINDIEKIQKEGETTKNFNYTQAILQLKQNLSKEEQELTNILEKSDMSYQMEKIKELKELFRD
jgi:hypothetical protein